MACPQLDCRSATLATRPVLGLWACLIEMWLNEDPEPLAHRQHAQVQQTFRVLPDEGQLCPQPISASQTYTQNRTTPRPRLAEVARRQIFARHPLRGVTWGHAPRERADQRAGGRLLRTARRTG
jgi:hypothetical protein